MYTYIVSADALRDNRYFMHYRTKGSKNGVRLYQYEDGTYTPLGRIHYGIGQGGKRGAKQEPNKGTGASTDTNQSKPKKVHLRKETARIEREILALTDKKYDEYLANNKDATLEDKLKQEDLIDKECIAKWDAMVKDIRKIDPTKANVVADTAKLAVDALFPVMYMVDIPMYAVKATSTIVSRSKTAHKIKTREEQCQKDPKTGLYLKNKDMSEEDDVKAINEGFMSFDTRNQNNCFLCTTTYELRRRGYEVYANGDNVGYTTQTFNRWYKNPKVRFANEFNITAAKKLRLETGKEPTLSQVRTEGYKLAQEALRSQPEGSRGNLCVTWKHGGGHSMIYEIRNGELIIRDAQIKSANVNPKTIFKQCTELSFCRTDNLKLNLKNMIEDGVFI